MTFEKRTSYIRAWVAKQRLNAELNMPHYNQHMRDGVHNLVQNRGR